MDNAYLKDAEEWLIYAKDDLGVAKHLDSKTVNRKKEQT